jgi:hypothetical protein
LKKCITLAVLATLASAVHTLADTSCKVTKAGYEALETGMSYADAVNALGCEGEELSSSEIGGIKTVMLMWNGEGIAANMNAMFQDDRLVSKAHFGLK